MLNKQQRANVAHAMSTALDDGVITQETAYHRIGESYTDGATTVLGLVPEFYEVIHHSKVLARNVDYMASWKMYCALKRQAQLVAWYRDGTCRVEFTRH